MMVETETFGVIIGYLGMEELLLLGEVSQMLESSHYKKIVKKQMKKLIFVVLCFG